VSRRGGPRWWRGIAPFVFALALCGAVSDARADLAGTLHRFVENNGALVSNGVFDALTPILQRLAVQGTDLPPTATSLGFVYRFDFETGAQIREAGSLGSIFLDRPRTLGRGAFAVGFLYEHIELTEFDGDDLAGQIELASRINFSDGSSVHRRLQFTQLDVTSDVVNLLATYGVTDRLDLSLLLPIAATRLDVGADKLTVERNVGAPVVRHLLMPSVSDEAAGVGDALLRAKWQVAAEPIGVAAVLGLRAPSGSEDDFQGLGDWTVEPDLLLAREFGRHEIHATLGVSINADDLTRSRARYGIGGSVQPWSGLAFFADVLGTSSFVEDEFDVVSPNDAFVRSSFIDQFQVGQPERTAGGSRVVERVPRTDVVDLHVGLKWNPVSSGFLFAGALVPLTRDGFRAEVVPTAGAQWIF
jgi:hypothetical protein